MTLGQILAAILLAMAVSAAGAWQVQDWRMGKKLAEQAGLHKDDLAAITNAAGEEHAPSRTSAWPWSSSSPARTNNTPGNYPMPNATRLLYAIALPLDVRLSVLLDAADSASGCNVPATPSAVGVVHGARRAQLDPAHAQRIISITDDGDQGLIALQACQAYVRAIAR